MWGNVAAAGLISPGSNIIFAWWWFLSARSGWDGGGPTLLNGVLLLDPDSHASSPWRPSCFGDLSYYPTIHLSHVTSVVASHHMHQDLEHVRIVLQIQQWCSNMRLHSIRISVDGMWYKILLHCQLISLTPDHIKLLYIWRHVLWNSWKWVGAHQSHIIFTLDSHQRIPLTILNRYCPRVLLAFHCYYIARIRW